MLVFVSTSVNAQNDATQPASGVVSSEEDGFDNFVKSVHQMIQAHWPYMNKVWPGLDYTNHNLIIFQLDDEDAVETGMVIEHERT